MSCKHLALIVSELHLMKVWSFNNLGELLHRSSSVFSCSQTFGSWLLQIKALPTWVVNSSTKGWFCLFGLFHLIKFWGRKLFQEKHKTFEIHLKNMMAEMFSCHKPASEAVSAQFMCHERQLETFVRLLTFSHWGHFLFKMSKNWKGYFNHQENLFSYSKMQRT